MTSNATVSLCIVLLCLRIGLLDIDGAGGKYKFVACADSRKTK